MPVLAFIVRTPYPLGEGVRASWQGAVNHPHPG